jgi:hypothetical protein
VPLSGQTRARVGTRLRRAFGNTLNLPHNLKPFSTDRKLRSDADEKFSTVKASCLEACA